MKKNNCYIVEIYNWTSPEYHMFQELDNAKKFVEQYLLNMVLEE